jgi:phosphatidylglycerophosphate synthase
MSRTPIQGTPTASRAATFRAQHRGGGLYSELFSQRVGSWLALAGHRVGLSPTSLTLAGLIVGVGSSTVVVIFATAFDPAVSSTVPPWLIGLLAGLGWQLAYALDCADGQLARVTGRTSSAGARLDILCDVATQISVVAAISAVAAAQEPVPPAWLVAVFAGTWMVNIVTSILAGGSSAASLVRSSATPVRVVKLLRDYGAIIAATALVLAFAPGWSIWLMAGFSAVNGMFLLASIGQAARASLVTTDSK